MQFCNLFYYDIIVSILWYCNVFVLYYCLFYIYIYRVHGVGLLKDLAPWKPNLLENHDSVQTESYY